MKISIINQLLLLILLPNFGSIFSGYKKSFKSKVHKTNSKYVKNGTEERVTFYARESVDSDRKIKRRGILFRKPNARATVLICHGFMCDKFDVSFLHLVFKKYNTMSFDFRAHGTDNKNQCCTFGRNEAYDVLAAIKFIKNDPKLKKLPVIIYGFSMGAVATIIAGEVDNKLCAGMILDCPFDSSDKLLSRGLDKIKLSLFGYEMGLPCSELLKSYAYSPYIQSFLKTILRTMAKMDATQIDTTILPVYPEEAIKHINVPVFAIACTNDDKAPVEAVQKIYEGAPGFKRFWISGGRKHFDPIFFKMHEYLYRVRKFVENILDDRIKDKVQQKVIRS